MNEGPFIGDCLRSLTGVVDDILVIDSGSTDETVKIARSLGARVLELPWLGFARTRNVALECSLMMDWVLFVDADERLTPALAQEVRDAAGTAAPSTDGFLIPRRNIVCGKIMRSSGWWPDYQLRLLRPDRCRYDDHHQVHEFPHCHGTTLALNNPLLHLNYRSWLEFAGKQFHYARLAAPHVSEPRKRAYFGAPVREFVRRYVTQSGIVDGLHGFAAATFLALAEFYRVWLARRSVH
ncbi:MAG: glycosyltransferase family 2 protein [Thermomicrobiales bacterium]